MDIVRAVIVTLGLLGILGLVTAEPSPSPAGGGVTTNDGGTPIPPPDGRGKR
jgi:hypothetical protein